MSAGFLGHRPWLPERASARIDAVLAETSGAEPAELVARVERLAAHNRQIHDRDCLNLNPASNRMNPRAEALLSAGLGTRASLGYPGDKYEVGLEAIEQIEVIAAAAAAEVFDAEYAEVRVSSGALANLYAFMATCEPGAVIIAPDPAIGGHVTHHEAGAAGLYRLRTLAAPVDSRRYTVDIDVLASLARERRPRLITIGGSLNLLPHPVAALREIADEVGAWLLYDAAHACGIIAGGAWPNPLSEGAHLMTMSTYKSLGGPPGGLVLTNDPDLARRLENIAYPGLTANHDAGRVAALAVTMADWLASGPAYAEEMVSSARALADELLVAGVPVFQTVEGPTRSHQLAVRAAAYGGGQAAAARLREANLLTCGIGLPVPPVDGDLNGLRIGTPEAVRLGLTARDMPRLADLLRRGLEGDPRPVAAEVTEWRSAYTDIHFTT